MIVPRLYLDALLATVRRDWALFMSYRLRVVSQVLSMLFTLTSFYYVAKLVRPDAVGPTGTYYAFAVVGIVSLSVLTSALSTSELIRMELMTGNFERLLISPLGPLWGVVSIAIFPIAWATAFAGVMLVVAAGIYGVPLDPAGIPLALPVAAFGALALACIGFFFVGALLAYKSSMGAMWVPAALSLLGGAYFPVKLFPGWVRWVSEVQPFTPAVDLLRHVLVRTPSLEPVWLELLKLGGFAAVLMPASLMVLWFAIKLSRSRGTIMEY